MSLKNLSLTSTLSGSLALYPLALPAQDYDAWTLNREVLNAAANYTSVLTSAHGQVRKYITWQWGTSLTGEDQKQRTTQILEQIASDEAVKDNPVTGKPLIPGLDSAVIDGFGIRFRYCDGMLLSYFAGTDFKHGLTAQQIVDAPELRARRAGTRFHGEPSGQVLRDGDGEGSMLQSYGGRSQAVPACMATEYDGALAENTVAYMTSATQKHGPHPGVKFSTGDESESKPCLAPHPLGGPVTRTREVETRTWRFDATDAPGVAFRDEGPWGEWVGECYRSIPRTTVERRDAGCPSGYSGAAPQTRIRAEFRYDYANAARNPGQSWRIESLTDWKSTGYTCHYVPPPDPPSIYKSCHRGDCIWFDSNSGGRDDAVVRRGRGRGGGGSGGDHESSVDVDGDGVGDFDGLDGARSAGFSGGSHVSGPCGGCMGPSRGGNGNDGNGGSNKIICTAMNARYGFGSYRQAIWLAHARRMSPYHQTGYHLIFLPLVRYGYRAEGKTRLAVRHALEHIARHRTADIRAEMQQRKRWLLGRSYRAVLEPLCYAVGWLADGRTVAGVEDVPDIARQTLKSQSNFNPEPQEV